MKIQQLLFIILLLSSSCVSDGNGICWSPSDYEKNTAQEYYDTFGTSRVSDAVHNKMRKKFTCHYRAGDSIYAYKTFWDTKYILVRKGKAITYVEGK